MAEVPLVQPCSNPGCDQPGTKSCSACKTTFYCCVICQTANWVHHKEECDGHLRKVGKANLVKAIIFKREHNYVQSLRYGELAATKLKQLKDRRLETVQAIDAALICKFNALSFMDRNREGMECAEERYTLWAMNHMRNPGSMEAALSLIESCIHNGKYEDAEHYARHAMFMINEMTDNFIPSDQRSYFLAEASYYLSMAILRLTMAGGIPQEETQKAGEEAIALARQALEIQTRLHGIECNKVATGMAVVAEMLDYFNNVDDEEVFRLYERANAITRRVEGSSSPNAATGKFNLGGAYGNRAVRAQAVNDLDRCLADYQLSLTHYREAARIYRVNNHVDKADDALRRATMVEEEIRRVGIARTAAAATRG